MEHTHTSKYVIGIVLGALLMGGIVFGMRGMEEGGTHRMSDGTMMHDTDMHSMMADMNASLQGKKGDEFDKAFIDEMVIHHQGAIDMAELALTNAKHQEIKDLANEIIKAQTKEINQMKQWRASWFR